MLGTVYACITACSYSAFVYGSFTGDGRFTIERIESDSESIFKRGETVKIVSQFEPKGKESFWRIKVELGPCE